MTNKWKSAVIELDNMLLADTQKEFTETAQTGYGIDGDFAESAADFANVRGTFETNYRRQAKSSSTSRKNPGWRMNLSTECKKFVSINPISPYAKRS